MKKVTYCGYVAIVGRPNVGKSTLLNKVVGQKVSITARKPQTTRHKILGIKSIDDVQIIYVDTPGLHTEKKNALNSYMRRAIDSALSDVDLVVFVVEALKWFENDDLVLQKLEKLSCPMILAVNKVDIVKDKKILLPFIQKLSKKIKFSDVIPVSAKKGTSVNELEKAVGKLLPESPFYFYPEQVTDRSERFLVAEIVREKLTRLLGHELPHELTVSIERFTKKDKIIHIAAIIYVEKKGQKIIIIGKNGSKLKQWYNQYYSPNNAIIVVVGDVNPKKVYLLAKKFFGTIKPSKLQETEHIQKNQPFGQRKLTVKAPAKLPMLLLGYNSPTVKHTNQPWQPYALALIGAILDLGASSRFEKELIRKQQIATIANVDYNLFSRLPNVFSIMAIPNQKHNIKELKEAIFKQIERLKTTLVTKPELDRVKAQLIANKTFSKDSLSQQAFEIGSLESVGLPWNTADQLITQIEKITPQQIQIAAKQFLTTNRLTITVLEPKKF